MKKNMSTPLISIIIPVYNVEAYLDACMRSVLGQTYENLQVILVDDGSPDCSGEICDGWAKRDDRVCVIHQENRGVSGSRNHGMELAEGEYFAFLDPDDLCHKEFIQEMYRAAQNYDADIVQCGIERFIDGKEPGQGDISDTVENVLDGREMNRRIYTSGVIDYTSLCNKLYKKHIFKNILFPEGKIHEDTAISYRLYYLANRVVVLPNKMYFYRMRERSIMTSSVSTKNLSMLDAFEQRLLFYAEKKDEELYHLCLERYFYSATVLYGKAIRQKVAVEIADMFYDRAKNIYAKIKDCSKAYSKKQLRKARLFISLPKLYCVGDRILGKAKRLLKQFKFR